MFCKTCGKEFFEDWRKDKTHIKDRPLMFCSRSCANSRKRNEDYKQKISIVMKSSIKGKEASLKRKEQRIEKTCLFCKKSFSVPKCYKRRFYCSRKCWCLDPNKIKLVTTKLGGYRQGSGNSKSGYYKNIFCGSTYELIWVIYQIDHNIPFERFSKKLVYNSLIYYPDFLQDSNIIEIKGYYTDTVEKQKLVAEKNFYNFIIKYKNDLKEEFAYFEKTYGLSSKKAYLLYENT